MSIIAASLLSADFVQLKQELGEVLQHGVDWIHVDVMDGHFVPNITVGVPVVRSLRQAFPEAFLDVHLMVESPENHIHAFAEAGSSSLTIHWETSKHPQRTLETIKHYGVKGGIAFNPATPLNGLEYLLPYLDLLLLMTVNPGFSGQSFLPEMERKISQGITLRNRWNPNTMVAVDGGITVENAPRLRTLGVDVLVSGNALFKSPNRHQTIQALKGKIG